MNEPVGVVRFTATERLLHWGFAFGYLWLLISGLPLMLPDVRGWIRGYDVSIGLRLHLAGAVVWVAAIAVVIGVGNRRRLTRTGQEFLRFERKDWRWLRRAPRWVVAGDGERVRLDAGVARFNAGQKVNAVFTAATSLLLLVTGLALIPVDRADGVLVEALMGAGSVTAWRVAHRALTLLVLFPLGTHLFFALVHPSTRPSLPGILAGRVDRAWAATHHPRWRGGGDEEDAA